MKINKEFTPITITIETIQDKELILDILEAAHRQRTGSFFGRNPYGDTLVSDIEHLMSKLK